MSKLLTLYRKYESFIVYVFFGVLTTLINIISFWLFDNVLHWNYLWANAMASFLSILFAFFTNKTWVFHSPYTTLKAFLIEMGSFFFARGVTFLIDEGIMIIGISWLHQPNMPVKIVDQVIIILLNYIFSKWIFKSDDQSQKGEQ